MPGGMAVGIDARKLRHGRGRRRMDPKTCPRQGPFRARLEVPGLAVDGDVTRGDPLKNPKRLDIDVGMSRQEPAALDKTIREPRYYCRCRRPIEIDDYVAAENEVEREQVVQHGRRDVIHQVVVLERDTLPVRFADEPRSAVGPEDAVRGAFGLPRARPPQPRETATK